MPGQLKPDAVCPKCGEPLLAIVDTSNMEGVEREYFHPAAFKRGRCRVWFTDHELARAERQGLELTHAQIENMKERGR